MYLIAFPQNLGRLNEANYGKERGGCCDNLKKRQLIIRMGFKPYGEGPTN